MAEPIESFDDLSEDAQECPSILITKIDVVAVISASGDVIEGARELQAERASHAFSIDPETDISRPDPKRVQPTLLLCFAARKRCQEPFALLHATDTASMILAGSRNGS